ncbi:MAG: hypothetical protein E7354_04440 [Clostridiales bacterium]|nr:hypothetical protein [Clostridiales bacterium]
MKFEVRLCSVLDSGTDIIVNAANNYLSRGGGVCGAIFERAGAELLEAECRVWGYVKTGSVATTNGFQSGAKYIIHAVGPNFYIDHQDWQEKLESVYKKSLLVADDLGVNSIAFPCISTGIFGCPIEESAKIAVRVVREFQPKNLKNCVLCCFTDGEYSVYNALLYSK